MPTISNIRVGAASSTNGTEPTPALPASLSAVDIMILAFYSRDDTNGTMSLPVAWTQLVNTRTTGGLLAVYYRVWQSGDAAPTITLTNHTTGTSGESAIAQIMAYAGGNTASPWDLVGTVSTNASQQNIGAIANAGVMGAEDMVLVVGGKRDDWTSVATLTGDGLTWNEIGEPDTTSGADAGLVWNYALNPGTFLSLTNKTFTVTGGAAATGMGVMITMNVSPNFGTSAQTLADFTSSASGSSVSNVSGTVATTLAAFTSAASGTETFTGTSAQTLAAFTSSVTALETFTGSSSQTLAAFTSSASGVETISGSSSQTLADFTSSASGDVESLVNEGTVAVTLADFTSSASGTETITGTSAQTLANFTSSVIAVQTISGSSAQTLAAFTSSASGVLSILGQSAQTLSSFTSSASGTETISGSSSQTLSDFTSDATGVFGDAVVGTSNVILVDFGSSASGDVVVNITGDLAEALDNFTSAADGLVVQNVTGSVAVTMANFTSTATGTVNNPAGQAPRLLIDEKGTVYILKNGSYISESGEYLKGA